MLKATVMKKKEEATFIKFTFSFVHRGNIILSENITSGLLFLSRKIQEKGDFEL